MKYDPYVYRLPDMAYTPDASTALNVASLRDLSREYTRLRGMATKGGQRLMAAGFRPGAAFSFPALTEMKAGDAVVNPQTLVENLARLAEYISTPERTVTGRKNAQRDKALDTLHEHGYDFVNKANIDRFGSFMEKARNLVNMRQFSSDEIVQAFELAEKAGIDPDELSKDFEEFSAQIDTAQDILASWDDSKPMSAETVRRRMGMK